MRQLAYALIFVAACVGCSMGAREPAQLSAVPVVVRLDCPDDSGWGSGVRLDEGRVLTAWHVADCQEQRDQDGGRDVGMVGWGLSEKGKEAWAGRTQPRFRAPVLGEEVECWGYPGDPGENGTAGLTVTTGVVANVEDGLDTGLRQITCPIQPGMSGGPVIGADGAVVGLIVAYYPGVAGWGYMEPAPFGELDALLPKVVGEAP